MSIPNLLAYTRLVLTPIVMALILVSPDGSRAVAYAAAATFVVAALTDLADGYLARRWRIVTTLGAFLDTVADKILVTGALVALVQIGTVSSWIAFIIIGREIAIMGLRSVAALDSSTVPPSIWGKWKATIQFVAITFRDPLARRRHRTVAPRPVAHGCRRFRHDPFGWGLLLEVPIGVRDR